MTARHYTAADLAPLFLPTEPGAPFRARVRLFAGVTSWALEVIAATRPRVRSAIDWAPRWHRMPMRRNRPTRPRRSKP